MTIIPLKAMRFAVAPMMDWTDRHCRSFHRLLSRHATLYTEMVTAAAIIHGPRDRLLGFDDAEHRIVVQLGGSDPDALAKAAKIAESFGYGEINLNVGCPSDRVQGGNFGACLMLTPDLVASCVGAMKAVVKIPVSVKCRLGVDEQDTEMALDQLADAVIKAGCDALTVHARKALLKGLSPKENREIPPLDYERVYRLKHRLGTYPVAINGGIETIDAIKSHLQHVDGVMLGRAAYHTPEILLEIDPHLFGDDAPFQNTFEALEAYFSYIERQLKDGVPLHAMTRHLSGLFHGRPGARSYRRHLATEGVKRDATLQTVKEALSYVARDVTRAA
ncbi:MAG: tRNA dihydrouridine(20/20a) synthase DusA [Alphaproteobacteria bacterium]|nr:tRNA dihydrouridine(20/20a) synthase DusA [Alphaproteobacteria bacterium]